MQLIEVSMRKLEPAPQRSADGERDEGYEVTPDTGADPRAEARARRLSRIWLSRVLSGGLYPIEPWGRNLLFLRGGRLAFLGGSFDRVVEESPLREEATALVERESEDDALGLGTLETGIGLVRLVDGYIDATQPFKLAKQEGQEARVSEILYACAETLRLASLRLWPAMPERMEELWRRLGVDHGEQLAGQGRGQLESWSRWGGLPTGHELARGEPLFPRYEED